jgi:hypothetical protein
MTCFETPIIKPAGQSEMQNIMKTLSSVSQISNRHLDDKASLVNCFARLVLELPKKQYVEDCSET